MARALAPRQFLNKTTQTIVGEVLHRNQNPESYKNISKKMSCGIDKEIDRSGWIDSKLENGNECS